MQGSKTKQKTKQKQNKGCVLAIYIKMHLKTKKKSYGNSKYNFTMQKYNLPKII
jgi:hypothetical protein